MTHFYHFFRYHNLKQHIKLHSGVKPYECNICNKRFTRNYTLRLHKQKVKFLTKFSEKNHEIFDISKNRFLTRKSNRTKKSRFYNFEITIFSEKNYTEPPRTFLECFFSVRLSMVAVNSSNVAVAVSLVTTKPSSGYI